MTLEVVYSLAGPVVLMQLLALGWTVNREIYAQGGHKQEVIALPDVFNIMSLFATIALVIVSPMMIGSPLSLARGVLGGAFVLIAFYPLCVAAHYRLWRRNAERKDSVSQGDSSPHYANSQELALTFGSGLIALAVAVWIGTH
ncbi:hypothetical protein [Granulicella arctica]|uniref:hypothetical protein n=1 Tax=Granulicella arctica TaxID=940613 RepID=UPI0021E0F6BF|nr:hypothetical protein [Granulicella arctica]